MGVIAQEADELALKINIDSKTGVQFLLLRSKISFALNNYDDSYFYAYRALENATKKQMKTEIKMLNELIAKNNVAVKK